jgi:preprotein translocase subunit YajC
MGSLVFTGILAAEGEGATGTGGMGDWMTLLIPMAMIFVIFFLLVIRPQMKRERERQEMLKGVKKNDKVVTTGGFMGTVVSVKEPWVVLKIDENKDIRIKVLLSCVSGMASPDGKQEDEKEESKGET